MSNSLNDESVNSNEVVTVKFRTDENETLTQAFDLKTTIGSLRSYLLQLLNVDPNKIVIERNGSTLEHGESLKELGATSLGIFDLDLRGDGLRLPKSYLPVVDVITVNIKKKSLVVEIEHCSTDKPWLGGYRNRDNGKVYHHAAVQTDFKPKMYLDTIQMDRWSQTCADKCIEYAPRDTWTQTTTAPDGRLLSSKPYQSYQSWLREDYVLSSVLKIQWAFRRMLARKRIQQTAVVVERQKTVVTEPKTVTTALESKQQHFYSLYTMIGKWWKKERQRIKEIEAENCRKAAQMNLLKKEIKFLLEMEKQRSELKYEVNKHDDITFLNKTSKPKIFKNKTGKLLTMDTVGNQKARVLRKLYVNIMGEQEEGNNRLDRAEILDELYALVASSSYKYKKNLLDVIAMEKDFAEMGADHSSLRSVQSRVEQMFRHFIRQPEVNPEADSYYRPTEKRILNVYTCIRCKRNLAATDFSLESRVNRTNVCANCEWTEQVGHKRIDMAPYRRMLKTIRHDEMKLAAYDSECFMMQPTEVYRLVSIVWREKSAVGECGQLNGLRLVRWRRDEPWSPWNCVLLTRAEADVHCRLDGHPADHYDAQFVNWVTNRHMTARLHFSNLVQAVKNRTANKAKSLSKNWKIVAQHFHIKT